MELNDIIVELLGRIKVLEKRVAALELRLDSPDGAEKLFTKLSVYFFNY